VHRGPAFKIVAGKLQEKGPLGRPRNIWENNIATALREILCESAN
jgi:hypothetical protein